MDSIQRTGINTPITNQAPVAPKEEKPQSSQADSVELGKPQDQQPPKAKWLVMSYIAADCNLEEFQIRNVDNMELAGSDPSTHVLVQIDRGPNPSEIDGGWKNCRRYYVQKDAQEDKLGSKMLQDLGRVDMSNGQTLKEFIVWGVKNYPADHVALVLNDHGGGFTGAMSDDSDGNFMSIPDLAKAVKEAEAETGKKIDIIGFDACLMAETEVANELKDNANILLASEETESGPGWKYSPMLGGKNLAEAIEKLRELQIMKIDCTPEEFAKIVVDVNRKNNNDIPTFSAVDLRNFKVVVDATEKLGETIIASKDKAGIKSAIRASESYGGGYNPYRDLRDEYDMCEKIINNKNVSDKAVKDAAKAVIESLKSVIIDNESNPNSHPNSHGLSLYAPTSSGPSGPGYGYNKLKMGTGKWAEALKSLGKMDATSEEAPSQPKFWPDGSEMKQKS